MLIEVCLCFVAAAVAVCENYAPDKRAQVDFAGGDCHGTKFYHWGGLTGVIGLIEDGLF